jgi:transcriptional regulator with XRE-family HTH domain
MDHKVHEGRNVKRFREMLGIKQESLAYELGEEWSQKKVSLVEAKESVDAEVLNRIAAVLKIPVEAFKNFDEEQAVNVIANTYTFQDFKDQAVASGFSHQPTFNPLDKLMAVLEENKQLYERLLASEQSKVALYARLLGEK